MAPPPVLVELVVLLLLLLEEVTEVVVAVEDTVDPELLVAPPLPVAPTWFDPLLAALLASPTPPAPPAPPIVPVPDEQAAISIKTTAVIAPAPLNDFLIFASAEVNLSITKIRLRHAS